MVGRRIRRWAWLAWLACCLLVVLPGAGVRLCFAADHVAVAVGNLEDCPGDHADGTPCTDVSLDVQDGADGGTADLGVALPAPPLRAAPTAPLPDWRARVGEFVPCRWPAPDPGRCAPVRLRRCVVLLI